MYAVAFCDVPGGVVWIVHRPDKPVVDQFVLRSGKKKTLEEAFGAARQITKGQISYYHMLTDGD